MNLGGVCFRTDDDLNAAYRPIAEQIALVGGDDDRRTEFVRQLNEEIDNPSLTGRVKCSCWLVGEDDLGGVG